MIVRKLTKADLAAYRQLRLEALTNYPEFFKTSCEEEKERGDRYFLQRLMLDTVVGAYVDDVLRGIIGFRIFDDEKKMQHTGRIWGVYVCREVRGQGIARALVDNVLEIAQAQVEKVILNVRSHNIGALKLYKSYGFEEYGFDRKSIKIGDNYFDKYMLVKFFETS